MGKKKYTVWAEPDTMEAVKEMYKKDNCGTQSEFVEKAIRFYLGYLFANKQTNFLPNIMTSTIKGILAESENRQNRMLFKVAVEMSMMMNIIAFSHNVERDTLDRLRGECVKEVKKTNGSFRFEDALDWQKG